MFDAAMENVAIHVVDNRRRNAQNLLGTALVSMTSMQNVLPTVRVAHQVQDVLREGGETPTPGAPLHAVHVQYGRCRCQCAGCCASQWHVTSALYSLSRASPNMWLVSISAGS